MAQMQKPDGVVVLPLWTAAALDQLREIERGAVDSALHHLATSGDRRALKILASPDPDRKNGTLYEMRVGSELRLLLLYREEAQSYEVVGINRRAA